MTDRIRPRPFRSRAGAIAAAFFAVAAAGCANAPGPGAQNAAAPASAASTPPAAPGAEAPAAPAELSSWVDKPGWTAQRDMIAAAHPLAAQAGQAMLKAGGTAVDAAIAAQMVLMLVEPQASGIGGGAFLLHANGKTIEAYDGRETAPAAATDRLFLDANGKPLPRAALGARTVGAPGALRSSSSRIAHTASCHGGACSSPRSGSPSKAFRSARGSRRRSRTSRRSRAIRPRARTSTTGTARRNRPARR